MPDFWQASGYHLLDRDGAGRMRVTPAFLAAYLERPEMQPVEESCAAERALHVALAADPDARDNYRHVLGFRDHLLAHGSVEAAYLALFAEGRIAVPPLFIDQLAHVILRNILEDCADPIRVRAGELLFRSQKITIHDGAVMAADEETVGMYVATGGTGGLGRLLIQNRTPLRQVEMDVLLEQNAEIYWQRSDRFDTVLDLTFTRPGLDALCRVLEAWIGHLLDITVRVHPMQSIQDEHWAWHVGLEPEASAILNDLYQGREVAEDRLARLLALFRLEFRDPSVVRQEIAGRPVYLGMAMTADNLLRLKPQNLLYNLPLAAAA